MPWSSMYSFTEANPDKGTETDILIPFPYPAIHKFTEANPDKGTETAIPIPAYTRRSFAGLQKLTPIRGLFKNIVIAKYLRSS